jgi:hypothetical protein
MRNSPLMTLTFLGLALSLTVAACDGGGDEAADTMTDDDTETGNGDGDPGDGDPGDGDGDTGGCVTTQPPECVLFVECISGIAPSQQAAVEAMYGAEGSCWCGTVDEANECFATCVDQVELALETHPTVNACHAEKCGIEELDPTQPYGPIENGACGLYTAESGEMLPQVPFQSPLGVPGGVCAPGCSGLANYCPESTQTSAAGTCYIQAMGELYCVSRCWVDSTIVGGTQCQCGATCQPEGAPDGENNMRGICTFE